MFRSIGWWRLSILSWRNDSPADWGYSMYSGWAIQSQCREKRENTADSLREATFPSFWRRVSWWPACSLGYIIMSSQWEMREASWRRPQSALERKHVYRDSVQTSAEKPEEKWKAGKYQKCDDIHRWLLQYKPKYIEADSWRRPLGRREAYQ